MRWQWRQLDQIICTWLHTDNHTSTSSLINPGGGALFLTPNQQRQSTEGNQSIEGKILKTKRLSFLVIVVVLYSWFS